jgi:hypothetical protein
MTVFLFLEENILLPPLDSQGERFLRTQQFGSKKIPFEKKNRASQ